MILYTISCKTAPPPITESPPAEQTSTTPANAAPQPVDDATRQALAAAKEKADKLRTLILDFGGPAYYPGECETAESHYNQAQALNPASAADYKKAVEQYTALANEYTTLSEKVLPRYVEARKEALQSARDKAAASAGDALAKQVAQADETVNEGLKLVEAQDYYGAADAFDDAQNRYGFIETEAACQGIRSEIETYKLNTYDPDTFAAAEQAMRTALAAYNEEDIPAAQHAAAEALPQYQTVAATGWEALAAERRRRANAERTKALNIKAHIAMKDDYGAADAVYSQGEEAFTMKDFKQAIERFTPAETMFTAVYKTTAEKRQIADSAIQVADKKITDTRERAKNAQTKLAGGKR
ncbi:MAG: hypothetical protein LBT14_10460 [Treponema sp.]|jgi:hypothetical protein|nr:hypothetical protein [Treponema sp.]